MSFFAYHASARSKQDKLNVEYDVNPRSVLPHHGVHAYKKRAIV